MMCVVEINFLSYNIVSVGGTLIEFAIRCENSFCRDRKMCIIWYHGLKHGIAISVQLNL